MKRNLLSSGNGWDLYLPKPILKLVGFNPQEDKVLFTIKNSTLYIEKINVEEIDNYTNLMVKSFGKCGGGWAIFMPLPVIELLNINPEEDMVEYIVDERTLIIKKAN